MRPSHRTHDALPPIGTCERYSKLFKGGSIGMMKGTTIEVFQGIVGFRL